MNTGLEAIAPKPSEVLKDEMIIEFALISQELNQYFIDFTVCFIKTNGVHFFSKSRVTGFGFGMSLEDVP